MLVKKSDVKVVYDFAKAIKAQPMTNTDIDLLFFSNDVIDKFKSIADPVQENIESLRKWHDENLSELQKKYSEKNIDGTVKTDKDEDGRDIVVFVPETFEEYKIKFQDLMVMVNQKSKTIEDDLSEDVDVEIQKISKSCLPKEMTPLVFDSIIKFVER